MPLSTNKIFANEVIRMKKALNVQNTDASSNEIISPDITIAELFEDIKNNESSLKIINLHGCKKLDSFAGLYDCPILYNLKFLNVSESNITLTALMTILSNAPNLQTLYIVNCNNLHDCNFIKLNPLKKLNKLTVFGTYIPGYAILEIIKAAPQFKLELELSFLNVIDKVALNMLRIRNPLIKLPLDIYCFTIKNLTQENFKEYFEEIAKNCRRGLSCLTKDGILDFSTLVYKLIKANETIDNTITNLREAFSKNDKAVEHLEIWSKSDEMIQIRKNIMNVSLMEHEDSMPSCNSDNIISELQNNGGVELLQRIADAFKHNIKSSSIVSQILLHDLSMHIGRGLFQTAHGMSALHFLTNTVLTLKRVNPKFVLYKSLKYLMNGHPEFPISKPGELVNIVKKIEQVGVSAELRAYSMRLSIKRNKPNDYAVKEVETVTHFKQYK